MAVCDVCFRHCRLSEGQTGACGARVCRGGSVRPDNYGKVTSLALDPIEKKPLRRFFPGSRILSVGSFGCNLRCPFCQNHRIARAGSGAACEDLPPERLVALALEAVTQGNIGLAFTYNEPLVGWEYVRDAAGLAHEAGLKTVLVTNGTAERPVLEALGPVIDAMNIDLKGFTEAYYRDVLGGSLGMVREFIARAVQLCHVELTTLAVPGYSDSQEEMCREAAWIASLTDSGGNVIGKDIPLHISRFFPRFQMAGARPTPVATVLRLVEAAGDSLRWVYPGNC